MEKPNPLTPFPAREGGMSPPLLAGEGLGERFSRLWDKPLASWVGKSSSGLGRGRSFERNVYVYKKPNPPTPFPRREGGEILPSFCRRGVGEEVFYECFKLWVAL